jgi:uncharacterized protein
VGRIFFLILLALVAYLAFFKGPRRSRSRPRAADTDRRPAEDMVTCAHCGVHLPQSDSVRVGTRHFCSEEHRRLGG